MNKRDWTRERMNKRDWTRERMNERDWTTLPRAMFVQLLDEGEPRLLGRPRPLLRLVSEMGERRIPRRLRVLFRREGA